MHAGTTRKHPRQAYLYYTEWIRVEGAFWWYDDDTQCFLPPPSTSVILQPPMSMTTLVAHTQVDALVLEDSADIHSVLMSGQADPKEGGFRPKAHACVCSTA